MDWAFEAYLYQFLLLCQQQKLINPLLFSKPHFVCMALTEVRRLVSA